MEATEKEMKEVADTFDNHLPEAPASANIKVWIEGFRVQFTTRHEKMSEVVKRVEQLIAIAKSKGWKPTWKKEEEEETKKTYAFKCPICGAPAQYKSGVKNGRKWAGIFCSVNKEHIKWLTVK